MGKAREEKHALAERSRFRRRDRPRAALLDDARRELRRGLARRSSARTASSARGVDPGRVASRAGADAERPSAEVRVEPGYVAVHHSGERTRRAIDRFGVARGRRTRATARPRDRATARASGPGDRARTPRAARGGFAGSPRPQRPASVVTSSAEFLWVPPEGTEKTRQPARRAPAPPTWRFAPESSRRPADSPSPPAHSRVPPLRSPLADQAGGERGRPPAPSPPPPGRSPLNPAARHHDVSLPQGELPPGVLGGGAAEGRVRPRHRGGRRRPGHRGERRVRAVGQVQEERASPRERPSATPEQGGRRGRAGEPPPDFSPRRPTAR